MLAMLWNWNQRFLGMKESGVYFAVRILFLAYSCVGYPSSSFRSSGNGRLKYSCLFWAAWPSSSAWAATVSSCRSVSDPADALFFSCDVRSRPFLATSERRLRPLLLTVNFRVAHLDLFVCVKVSGAPVSTASAPSGLSLDDIIGTREELKLRAGPGHPRWSPGLR